MLIDEYTWQQGGTLCAFTRGGQACAIRTASLYAGQDSLVEYLAKKLKPRECPLCSTLEFDRIEQAKTVMPCLEGVIQIIDSPGNHVISVSFAGQEQAHKVACGPTALRELAGKTWDGASATDEARPVGLSARPEMVIPWSPYDE